MILIVRLGLRDGAPRARARVRGVLSRTPQIHNPTFCPEQHVGFVRSITSRLHQSRVFVLLQFRCKLEAQHPSFASDSDSEPSGSAMRRSVLHFGRWATSWSCSTYSACHTGAWAAAKSTGHDKSTAVPSLCAPASITKIRSFTCTGHGTASQPLELLDAVEARLVARGISCLNMTVAQLHHRRQVNMASC